ESRRRVSLSGRRRRRSGRARHSQRDSAPRRHGRGGEDGAPGGPSSLGARRGRADPRGGGVQGRYLSRRSVRPGTPCDPEPGPHLRARARGRGRVRRTEPRECRRAWAARRTSTLRAFHGCRRGIACTATCTGRPRPAWAALQRDKKSERGELRLVLLNEDGPVVATRPEAEVRTALNELIAD